MNRTQKYDDNMPLIMELIDAGMGYARITSHLNETTEHFFHTDALRRVLNRRGIKTHNKPPQRRRDPAPDVLDTPLDSRAASMRLI